VGVLSVYVPIHSLMDLICRNTEYLKEEEAIMNGHEIGERQEEEDEKVRPSIPLNPFPPDLIHNNQI